MLALKKITANNTTFFDLISVIMSSAKHVRFTPIEDEQLKQLVIKYGTNNWHIIASFLPGRNARQVHDRWCNTLSPALNRSEFTPEEDQLLMRLHEELGPKWVKMAKYFNGRSDTSLKSRWNKLQRQLKSEASGIFGSI